jgi:hypothetical protein
MAAQKRQLSLDANLVFDLAAGRDFAHDFREIFQRKGYAFELLSYQIVSKDQPGGAARPGFRGDLGTSQYLIHYQQKM